jgi:peptidoglycan/xylan/chitin deacetylase (PgdA/CDA1 family)
MRHVPRGAPFSERGGRLRGVIDVLAGRYPLFVFGFGVGDVLPVFHFHDTTPEALEPAFDRLANNGYTTVTCDEMSAIARGTVRPRPRTVLLAFDDALASVWLVVAPLLRRYGLTAVTYAIPGRVADAPSVRPTLDDGPVDAAAADFADNPFATWPELRALVSSGVVDVQSHTWSHSMQFCGDQPNDVVRPSFAEEYFLDRPRLNVDDPPSYLDPSRIGHPLFPRRSRMSSGRRFLPDPESCARVEAFVAEHGGVALFRRERWRGVLADPLRRVTGRWETKDEQHAAIDHEIIASREVLEARLGTRVRHLCLPWGVTSAFTQARLAHAGYDTAIANRMSGTYAVRPGDDPYFLKRLPNRYIFALPGRGRKMVAMG